MKSFLKILAFLSCGVFSAFAQNSPIKVNFDKPISEIQPTMWGVFFEDINFGADGGIYAELIKNRSFEFNKPLMGWKIERKKNDEGQVLVQRNQGNNLSNPHYLTIKISNAQKGDLGLTNEGFKAMGIKKDLRYDFSVMYRKHSGEIKLHLELLNAANEVIGSGELKPAINNTTWNTQELSFTANAVEPKGKFRIWFEGTGEADFDMISLFPSDTWKNRKGGMRADMVQLLADMKPGFVRFPGGCIVEGFDLTNRYQWKKTLGALTDRQLIMNRWNVEFAHRPAPDYFQTFGLGFFEYFQLCDDIGAEPLPILNCGMACQFNTAEVVPVDDLQPYIQDALDLIEFANGDVSTKWGKIRANMGHKAPFNLKMMGVGNENWGPQYVERLKLFEKNIKAKYPNFKLVYSSGYAPNGELFEYLNKELRGMKADLIDEHYYQSPAWFFANATRYDNYDRNSSKVFAGEYAAQSISTVNPNNQNTWKCALSEAAFMTGLERNAAVVNMASYAPLFAHAEGWQWTPDLIWVDNLRSYGTPDYQVQKLFSLNKGTNVLSMLQDGKALVGQDSLYASAAFDKATNEVILKVVNALPTVQTREIQLDGRKKVANQGKLTHLQGDLKAVNSFEEATKIAPTEKELPVDAQNKSLKIELPPYSFSVVRVKIL